LSGRSTGPRGWTITPASPDPAAAGAPPLLRVEGITKLYRKGTPVLRGIDLEVPRGQVLALIGPSGAGKSTFIRCVNRLVEPTSGRVFLDGEEIVGLRPAELRRARRKIGMIFQEFALVERLTVLENVLSGRLGYVGVWRSLIRRFPASDVERARALLARLELPGFDDTRADALSGGQRQRVGIARALMQEPELLLVDEPTASLDPRTSRHIMRLIVEVASERKLAVIVNMHDVPLARSFAQRIVGLRDGSIVYDGGPGGLTGEVLTGIYGDDLSELMGPTP